MDPKDIRLEVTVGNASPPAVTLRAGEQRDTFSVGFEGSWSVGGEGILAVHAYFAFDGAELYAMSADKKRLALLDGKPLGLEWVKVPVPCKITLGKAVVLARNAIPRGTVPPPKLARVPEGEHTIPLPMPPPPRFMVAAPPPSEKTRVAPIDSAPRPEPPVFSPNSEVTERRPSVAQGGGFSPPAPAPTGELRSPLPSVAQGGGFSPPAPPPTGELRSPHDGWRAKLPAFWREASIPKRITYVLLPVALILFFIAFFIKDDGGGTARRTASRPPLKPSAAAPPSTQAATAPTTPPHPALSVATPEEPASAPHPRGSALPAGKKTLERQAVDLVAAGAYADAAKVYEELAQAQPERPELREAARILRARTGP